MMEAVVYLRSWKIVGLGLAAVAMGALAGVLAFDTDARRWTYFSAAVLLFGMVFFSGLGLALVVRAFSPYPAIRLDPSGIQFRSVPFMSGRVAFSNISGVRALRYGAAQYISLNLKDEEIFIDSQARILRAPLRYMSRNGHPTCVILVGVGPGEEHRAIAERLRAVVQSNHEREYAA